VDFTKRPTGYFDVVKTLRAGGPHTFDLEELTGIIKLPSFHAALLIVFVYVHRPPSRSFIPFLTLNALMLLSIPSEGHHYLVDMIAGGTLATLCILAFRTADAAFRSDLPAPDTDGLQVGQEFNSQLQPVRSRFRTPLPPT
jgi:membrane-associated phospholipid phosphatase